MTSSKHPQSYS